MESSHSKNDNELYILKIDNIFKDLYCDLLDNTSIDNLRTEMDHLGKSDEWLDGYAEGALGMLYYVGNLIQWNRDNLDFLLS